MAPLAVYQFFLLSAPTIVCFRQLIFIFSFAITTLTLRTRAQDYVEIDQNSMALIATIFWELNNGNFNIRNC